MQNAIIIERDYKGEYERFALTPEEFQKEYLHSYPDLALPTAVGQSETLAPLVHIWYAQAQVGSDIWNRFFTDMQNDLPESDIANGNLAYIRWDFMQSLKPFVFALVNEASIDNTQMEHSSDELHAIRNLISAMSEYGRTFSWCDSDIIDALISCGINRADFERAGAGDFVKDYFEESAAPSREDKKIPLDNRILSAESKSGDSAVIGRAGAVQR